MNNVASSYEDAYRLGHPFTYQPRLYRPFVRAIIKKAKLRTGCTVLDVGCGQGFFTGLFTSFGFKAVGVDLSLEGLRCAREDHGSSGALFEFGEAMTLSHTGEFDCVFVRGLSLYNRPTLEFTHDVTAALLGYLKPGGVMIFAYGTNLSPRKKKDSWEHHSLPHTKQYFSRYPGAHVYFTLRIDTLLLGSWTFCSLLTNVFGWISRITGLGGELIALIPRASHETTTVSPAEQSIEIG